MTLDDEVKLHMAQLPSPPLVIDEWQWVADKLSDSFEWVGSKIAWSKSNGHKSCDLNINSKDKICLIRGFISDSGAEEAISKSKGIYYVNDSPLDFSLLISSDQFESVFYYLAGNIPQHHYFFDIDDGWCLVISSEGYADLGLFKGKDIDSFTRS